MGPEFANPRKFLCSTEFKLLYQWHGLIPEWGMTALHGAAVVTDVDAELGRMVTTAAGRFGPLAAALPGDAGPGRSEDDATRPGRRARDVQ